MPMAWSENAPSAKIEYHKRVISRIFYGKIEYIAYKRKVKYLGTNTILNINWILSRIKKSPLRFLILECFCVS